MRRCHISVGHQTHFQFEVLVLRKKYVKISRKYLMFFHKYVGLSLITDFHKNHDFFSLFN